MDEWNEIILKKINEERKLKNLHPIEYSDKLHHQAFNHSANMAIENKLYHKTEPNVLQNVGQGYTNFVLPKCKVFDAWMTHPPHAKNILEPKIRYMGSSYNKHYDQNYYFITLNLE
jgi:uncharacterized protein YkwD